MTVETVPLRDLCDVRIGRTPSRSDPRYWGGPGIWISISELNGRDLSDSREHISELAIRDVMPPPVPAGTLLFSFKLSIGKMAVSAVPLYTNEAIAALPIRDPDRLDRDYLRYALMATSGAAQTNHAVLGAVLNKAKVEALPIPLVPLSDQHRIVDMLSRAENIVRMRREAEQKAKEIIPSLFLDMFGDPATNPRAWEVRNVGDVIHSAEYGTSTKASEDGRGMRVIRMGNVDVTGRLNLADLKYVVLPEAERRRYALETGDILFNRTNSKELVGKTGIWRPSEPAVAASYFIRVRVNEDTILPDYFWAFMNTRHMKSVLYSTARGAIGQSNINTQELRAFVVPCPPTSRQRTFARRTAEALDLEGQQSLASETARTVFQALLAGVFHQ